MTYFPSQWLVQAPRALVPCCPSARWPCPQASGCCPPSARVMGALNGSGPCRALLSPRQGVLECGLWVTGGRHDDPGGPSGRLFLKSVAVIVFDVHWKM